MSFAKWRGSASLILAARNKLVQSKAIKNCDYDVLMIGRPHTGTFASSTVFPGGVHEVADESREWLKLFQKFGVPKEKLSELIVEGKSMPEVFNKFSEDSLHREISLRIAALRETFEEVGILITREKNSFTSTVNEPECATVHTDFDSEFWQKKVHANASEFINLFNELQILPDLWRLHEWSTWMSPYKLQKRFQTVFYVVGLNEIPKVCVDAKEVSKNNWRTPEEFLSKFHDKRIKFITPQVYELSRLCNFATLNNLLKFAYNRASKNGMDLLLPVLHQCTDGTLGILPGDEMYPNNPSSIEDFIIIDKSIEEFRANAKYLHRVNETTMKIDILNINLTDGQILPKIKLIENKL